MNLQKWTFVIGSPGITPNTSTESLSSIFQNTLKDYTQSPKLGFHEKGKGANPRTKHDWKWQANHVTWKFAKKGWIMIIINNLCLIFLLLLGYHLHVRRIRFRRFDMKNETEDCAKKNDSNLKQLIVIIKSMRMSILTLTRIIKHGIYSSFTFPVIKLKLWIRHEKNCEMRKSGTRTFPWKVWTFLVNKL